MSFLEKIILIYLFIGIVYFFLSVADIKASLERLEKIHRIPKILSLPMLLLIGVLFWLPLNVLEILREK